MSSEFCLGFRCQICKCAKDYYLKLKATCQPATHIAKIFASKPRLGFLALKNSIFYAYGIELSRKFSDIYPGKVDTQDSGVGSLLQGIIQ